MTYRVGRLSVLSAFVMMVTFLTYVVQTFDLNEEAFDDQYINCQMEMEKKLTENDVLNNELKNNEKLKEAWKRAKFIWMLRKRGLKSKIPADFKNEHGIALLTYTSRAIRKDVDNAVKSAGKNYINYMENFGFKWLHFYVTMALQILAKSSKVKDTQVYCKINERATSKKYVKFGHFYYTTKSLNNTVLRGENSIRTLVTRYGVSIEDFSAEPCEEEVMVPGYEVFNLGKGELNTTGKLCSNFNCAYTKGSQGKQLLRECINKI